MIGRHKANGRRTSVDQVLRGAMRVGEDTDGESGGGAGCEVSPYPLLAPAVLPGEPPQPCPDVLTEEEAIRYLRLDTVEIKDPGATLRRYRDSGLLRATQLSKRLFYRRVELERFLRRQTDENPR